MSLKVGKREVDKFMSTLEGEYDSPEDAAKAALEAAWSIYEDKAAWTVVGQVHYDPHGGGWVDPEDARVARIALGRYATEKQAEDAARSLRVGSNGEEFKAWVLPVHHGTPHSYFTEKKKERQAKNVDDHVWARQKAAVERASAFFEQHPGAGSLPEDFYEEADRCGKCGQLLE